MKPRLVFKKTAGQYQSKGWCDDFLEMVQVFRENRGAGKMGVMRGGRWASNWRLPGFGTRERLIGGQGRMIVR